MQDEQFDVIVIGGGASGMMAAGRLGELGKRVLLVEKNEELGRKLSITGGKRCNITNAEFDVRAFLENFPEAKEFLYSPFSVFSSKDTFTFFEGLDLPLKVEALKRAFPQSGRAKDVTATLARYMADHTVKVLLKTNASALNVKDGRVVSVATPNRKYEAPIFVLATGGVASPETGSTGDGFRYLKEMGHTVIPPSPAIVPLTTSAKWVHRLSGITLPVKIKFTQRDEVKIRRAGSILFTHYGISGPMILNAAHEVSELRRRSAVEAVIDLYPSGDHHELTQRLLAMAALYPNRLLKNTLTELYPARLAETILAFPELDLASRKNNALTKDERKKLVDTLKSLRFPITGTRGFEDAVIADGGVDLREVDTKTMRSKKFDNLYLLGDVLNINRPSGGYSLQLCWTSAWVAARAIAALSLPRASPADQ